MIAQGTTEAETMLTCAGHSRYNFTKVPLLYATLNSVFAVRRRAPLQVFFVIDIGTCKEDLVSV